VPVIVQKYGGSSVADIDRIGRVADHVVRTKEAGNQVVVVVSAMGKTTDDLLALARQVTPEPAGRELDMLLTVGERITMSLLSMAIQARGHEAISFTGSQSGIVTSDSHLNARIVEVRPYRIQDELERGRIVIVAGYQGTSYKKEVTTLGRGGSDTTAIALAAALKAEAAEIYSDVDGVYTADPRVVADARRLDSISADEMMTLSKAGARVLAAEALDYARRHGVALYAKASHAPEAPGTIVRVDQDLSDRRFAGVTGHKEIIYVQFRGGVREEASIFECLSALGEEGVLPYRSHVSLEGTEGATFLFATEHLSCADAFVARVKERFGPAVTIRRDIGTVTLVGAGIAEDADAHQRITAFLNEHRGLIHQVFFAPLSVTMLVASSDVDHLVQDVHEIFIDRLTN
jgi:aspartate kinase